jgi:hypothetical protein
LFALPQGGLPHFRPKPCRSVKPAQSSGEFPEERSAQVDASGAMTGQTEPPAVTGRAVSPKEVQMKRSSPNIKFIHATVVSAAVLGLLAAPAFAYTGQALARKAKVSLHQAEMAAKKVLPGGRITDRELEREKGGSGLRYSFDVAVKGKTHEVGVDAMSGKVIENSIEGPNAD